MPFDGRNFKQPQETKADPLTREQKLERLLYHLSLATDAEQYAFRSCLAHRCTLDPALISDGLPTPFWHNTPRSQQFNAALDRWFDYFGLSRTSSAVFAAGGVERKKLIILGEMGRA